MKIIFLMISLAISQLSFAHGDQHKKMNQQASFQQEEWVMALMARLKWVACLLY